MTETTQSTLDKFAQIEENQKITFNDRSHGLLVTRRYDSKTGSSLYLEGPRGGSYRMYLRNSTEELTVERDAEQILDKPDWTDETEVESLSIVAEPEEVEPPAEVGDEYKKEITLECVDWTGEFEAYRVVDVDRSEHELTLDVVKRAESRNPDEWLDQITISYQDLEGRISRGLESVDSLEEDEDVTLEDVEDEPEVATDGGVVEEELEELREGDVVDWSGESDEESPFMVESVYRVGSTRWVELVLEDSSLETTERDVLASLREGAATLVERGTESSSRVDSTLEELEQTNKQLRNGVYPGARLVVDGVGRDVEVLDVLEVEESGRGWVRQQAKARGLVRWARYEVVDEARSGRVGEDEEGNIYRLKLRDGELRLESGELLTVATDGGALLEDESEFCEDCQRYRLDCAHSDELRADGSGRTKSEDSVETGMPDYEDRASELSSETALTKRESDVRALKELGLSHSEIAEELDLSPSTVDEYSRRITKRVEHARRTVELVDERDVETRD